MSVRIRLTRVGKTNKPYFRVVAAPREKPRDGSFLEVLGTFHPKNRDKKLTLNKERYDYWLSQGALPTRIVTQTLKKQSAGGR